MDREYLKGVSIVVCCYNSAQILEPTLRHIANQNVQGHIEWEVIVVDNNSSDNTSGRAEQLWSDLARPDISFGIVKQPIPGLMNARQKGIDSTKYEYIIFCDDDNSLCSQYVSVVNEIFEKNDKVGICNGNSYEELPNDFNVPFWWEELKSGYAVGLQGTKEGVCPESKMYFWGAGIAFRRSALNELYSNSFKHHLVGRRGEKLSAGEDGELCMGLVCLGYKLYYSDRLWLKHRIRVDRISTEILKKQLKGFAKAGAINSIYIKVIQGKKSNWFVSTVYYGYLYLKSLGFPINKIGENELLSLKYEIRHVVFEELFLETFYMGPLKYKRITKSTQALVKQRKI